MLRASLLVAAAALAAASSANTTWSIIAKNIGTIATGISFNSETEGYVPLDENGVGACQTPANDGYEVRATKAFPHRVVIALSFLQALKSS
jgi:hypothetical protein